MTFPHPSPLEWREAAQKALKDRPIESLMHLDADQLVTRPLYAGVTGVQPIFAPRPSDSDGRAWDLRTLVEGDEAGMADEGRAGHGATVCTPRPAPGGDPPGRASIVCA